MQIAISTIIDTNLGNRLQNFALEHFLQNMDCDVQTINAFPNRTFVKEWPLPYYTHRWNIKQLIAYIIDYHGYRSKIYDKHYFARCVKFKEFNDKHMHLVYNDYHKLADKFEHFISGSDQVWNPNFITSRKMMEYRFLQFAPPEKRISYAASFGISEIPEQYKADYAKWLSEFKCLSVREQAGVDIIKHLTGRDAELHVDPTLLLSQEEWSELESKPIWYDESKEYLVTYFLGNRTEAMEQAMAAVAKERQLEFIHIIDRSNLDWYKVDPSEFVYLIHHAKFVYTDSFHASVFAIIFNKPFVVCEREQGAEFAGKKNMNSRIDTLLGYFDLQARRGTVENAYKVDKPYDVDFSKVPGVLAYEKQRSLEYLQMAMGLE